MQNVRLGLSAHPLVVKAKERGRLVAVAEVPVAQGTERAPAAGACTWEP